MTQIIGICGKKRHGKNTVAEIAVSYLRTRSNLRVRQVAFADTLRTIASTVYDLSEQEMADENKEKIIPRWGVSLRTILKTFGDAGRSIHSGTWASLAVRNGLRHPVPDVLFITDLRYLSEAALICPRVSTRIWRVVRPGVESDDQHSSETEQEFIRADATILNDGSAEDMKRKVIHALKQTLLVRPENLFETEEPTT